MAITVVVDMEDVMKKLICFALFVVALMTVSITLQEQGRDDVAEGDVVNLKKICEEKWDSVLIVNTPQLADEETQRYVYDILDKYDREGWFEHVATSVMIFYREGTIQKVRRYTYRTNDAIVYCISIPIDSLPNETFIAYPSDMFTVHVQNGCKYAVLNPRESAR